MKIVVCSDNHYNFDVLDKILADNPDADYYWHLGDSEANEERDIYPFASVRGNNDYLNLPVFKIFEVGGHRFFLTHGHRYLRSDFYGLYEAAVQNNCDVLLYGHTHMFSDYSYEGIRFLNPGSCRLNRDGTPPSYMIINIDDDHNIDVKRVNIIKK